MQFAKECKAWVPPHPYLNRLTISKAQYPYIIMQMAVNEKPRLPRPNSSGIATRKRALSRWPGELVAGERSRGMEKRWETQNGQQKPFLSLLPDQFEKNQSRWEVGGGVGNGFPSCECIHYAFDYVCLVYLLVWRVHWVWYEKHIVVCMEDMVEGGF